MEAAEPLKLTDLWTPLGLVLGFQLSLLSWRIQREATLSDDGKPVHLAPSDYLGIGGVLIVALGGFIAPNFSANSVDFLTSVLKIGVLFFVCHILSLCGHYELYGKSSYRSDHFFPKQEKVTLSVCIFLLILFSMNTFDIFPFLNSPTFLSSER